MKRKRIRWAASIYERGSEELKEVAELIAWRKIRLLDGLAEKIQQLEVLANIASVHRREQDRRTNGSSHDHESNLPRAVLNCDGRGDVGNRNGMGAGERG